VEQKQELTKIENKRNEEVKSLTDRELRARAAELRLQSQQGSMKLCDNCKTPLTMVPFERIHFKYCSMNCLKVHKQMIENVQIK